MIGRAYRRRTARPVLLLVIALLVAVVLTWSLVLGTTTSGPSGLACPAPTVTPPGLPALTAAQSTDALDRVAPAPPGTVRIRVFNGGGQRGQANLVASQLGELGFTEAADPVNDPYYPNGNLTCRGTIRYGAAGAAGARTVSLVLPCLALIQDTRPDDVVDVAIGAAFGEVNPSKAARDALDQLGGPAGPSESSGGAAAVDPELLARARAEPC